MSFHNLQAGTSLASAPYHRQWTDSNQAESPETALDSPLLSLHRSSDVDPMLPEQVEQARAVLRRRRLHGAADERVLRDQRQIVERFLKGRVNRFGLEETMPFEDFRELAEEGRDTFVVVKFMDEAPHIAATLHSLLQQTITARRVVIVAVDNNSTDGTDQIVHRVMVDSRSDVRLKYLVQRRPGAGHSARLGVDRCIATVLEMCRHDGRWDRLQNVVIGVTDGDTVYHGGVLAEIRSLLDADADVDGVMPFLTYKFTAALRLFNDYLPAYPEKLAEAVQEDAVPVTVDMSLGDDSVHDTLVRNERLLLPDGRMRLRIAGKGTVDVPLPYKDEHGQRFGVIVGQDDERAFVLEDRNVVREKAPVLGFDAAMLYLDRGVSPSDKWRWHTLIGHDLFLYWSFAGMGLPEQMIYPDSSDALKTFRVWSFAIGGQHQLRRDDLRIATGSDYQSGRVLQAMGCALRLGRAEAFAETEIDRLIKMIRNFSNRQSVFYGGTRASSLERATGLYVHMTRIQPDLERELRAYDDEFYQSVAFPERVLFPLRWMLQNAFRFYAHDDPEAKAIVQNQVIEPVFGMDGAAIVARWFSEAAVARLAAAPYHEQQDIAEGVAEGIIAGHYPALMAFYTKTLRQFLTRQAVPTERWEWLLDGVTDSRNAILQKPPPVHPAAVWAGAEFVIDVERGQVTGMRTPTPPAPQDQHSSDQTAEEAT